jgi:hypothetical protein
VGELRQSSIQLEITTAPACPLSDSNLDFQTPAVARFFPDHFRGTRLCLTSNIHHLKCLKHSRQPVIKTLFGENGIRSENVI